ncbi:MAG: glutaredoxin domain-containing protein [Verrucomicrobiae bacterium]|nr:glutaredoxin domain-containing protein [Verrucomicrobiae bacterium]
MPSLVRRGGQVKLLLQNQKMVLCLFADMNKKPTIIAYLKPWCGWSNGVRAVLQKYNLPYEDRDIIGNIQNRIEMVQKSGQELSPCVEVDGHMLADISGEELEQWLVANGYVQKSDAPTAVPINQPCSDEEHAAQRSANSIPVKINF